MKNENCDRKLTCDDYKYNHCDGCGANKPIGDLISRSELKRAFEKVYPLATNEMGGVVNKQIYEIINNAPTVEPKLSDEQIEKITDLLGLAF